MVPSDMDDGDPFLDVINENDLFGHDNDTGPSSFSWADEFLSTAEGEEESNAPSQLVQNHENISPTEVAPPSIETHHQLSTQQNAVSSQAFMATGPTLQNQGSLSLGGVQMVQTTGLVQQAQVQNPVPAVQQPIAMSSLGQLQQGTGNQIVQGPNGQLILKTANGGQILLQTQPHLQTLQQASSPVPQLQQYQTNPQMINRILAPSQSPQTANASHATASSPHVSRSLTPVQSFAGMGPVTMVTTKGQGQIMTAAPNVNVLQLSSNNNTQQQVLTRNLPIQLPNTNTGINLQGQSTVLQPTHGQGSLIQHGQNPGTLLQQGQGQAVLSGQGQNIVNTQNTVIQNPNVVNLNVAHVLCNNPQLQNQSSSTVHHMAPNNIQGTLIQTADGKHIIIPNQQMTQGQSINIQNLPQMTIQPQLNLAQSNNSTGSNMNIGNTSTVLQGNLALGNIGNVLRMTNSGTTQPETKPQSQQINNATHFIGVNQQGHQILIQRTPTPTGQQQNIILRAVNPSNLVLPQQQTSGVTGSSTQLQTNQTVTTQPIMMTSQGQQSVQLQRIVTNNQGQQVKLVSQQTPGMPLTINLAGSNLSNIQSGVQTIQVLPQQAKQVNSSGLVGSDGTSQGVISSISGSSQSQVGMIITSQAFNNSQNNANTTKATVRNSQSNQQLHTQITMAPNSSQAVQLAQVTQQQTAKFATNSNIQQMDTQTGNNPQQLVQTLQNIHIPISSPFQNSNSVPNLSTANTTPVTTTITQSNVQQTYVTSLSSTPNSQVVSSVTFQQSVPVSQKQQHILQARDSAPKLQHTIQISAEAQQQLARIQTEIKQLSSLKTLNAVQKGQFTKLMELQKRILSQGQLQVRQVQNLQTTSVPSPLTQHLLNQQNSQQQLSVQTSQTNQDVKPLTTMSPQLINNQQTSRVLGQLKTENSSLMVKDQSLTSISSSVSSVPQIQQTGFLQSSLSSTAVKGKLVIKPEPSSTLPCNFPSSQTSSEPIASFSQTQFASQIKMENSMTKTMPQSTSSVQESSQVPSTVPKNPSAMVHHVAPAPPGKVAIPASPQVAVLTQIKIGNHTLSLSLTPQQKEKVLGYLSKMTPEMQQQQISMLLKLQQQQQLQLQVQQQVQAQQNLQQQKQQQQTNIVNSIAAQKSTKIPLTVQQLDSTKVKSNEQPAPVNQTVTISPALKPVSFATLSSTQLIHQQMSKDQDNAVQPDTKTPFKSRRDTYRRLLRYHVYQAKLPPQSVMDKDETMFQDVSEVLLQKKDKMFEKFRVLLLQESMREKKTAEMLMIQRLLNEDLTETVKREKEIAKTDPDMFEPMPMKYLKREDKTEQSTKIDVSVKQEKIDFDPSRVKQEDITMTPTRPSTPKVKLVIRNNGQNFTSTLAESNSGSDDGDYHDSEEDMEVKSEGQVKQESDIRLVNESLLKVKSEQNDVEEEENLPWNNDSDKPFENYMGADVPADNMCENSPVVNDTGQDYNSISSDAGEEDSLQLNSATMNDEEEQPSFSSSFETSDMLENLTTSNQHSQDFSTEFHSKDHPQRLNDSFVDQNFFGSQGDTKSNLGMVIDDSHDKQLYSSQSLFSDDEKVPFSQNELFSQSMENTITRQDSISSHSARTVSSVSNFPQSGHAPLAQYEPISSPEIDHDDTFSNMITHRVDSSYTIGVGDQKSSTQLTAPDFSSSSFPSQPLSVKSSMDASDEETTLYSDSDKEPDPQDALLKAQMESAINSIVSLNQDSSPYSLDTNNKASNFFSHHNFEDSQTSQSDDSQPTSPAASITEDKEGDVSMDDDLDAAVQSILM